MTTKLADSPLKYFVRFKCNRVIGPGPVEKSDNIAQVEAIIRHREGIFHDAIADSKAMTARDIYIHVCHA